MPKEKRISYYVRFARAEFGRIATWHLWFMRIVTQFSAATFNEHLLCARHCDTFLITTWGWYWLSSSLSSSSLLLLLLETNLYSQKSLGPSLPVCDSLPPPSVTPHLLPQEHTIMDIVQLGTSRLVLPSGNGTLIFPFGHFLDLLQSTWFDFQ